MSSTDSKLNLVETDRCPNFSRSAVNACSLDCLPSASWEMDSNAISRGIGQTRIQDKKKKK